MTANIEERTRPSVPTDTFAARLVLARHHAGRLSIEKAAAMCGLNAGNWAHWEDGRKPRDRVEVADAIEAGLGIDATWLLRGRRPGDIGGGPAIAPYLPLTEEPIHTPHRTHGNRPSGYPAEPRHPGGRRTVRVPRHATSTGD